VAAPHGTTVPTQRLIDTGRRVAENIQFPGKTTITPEFGLRPLPDGMRICAFDIEEATSVGQTQTEFSTSYSLGTCTTVPPIDVGMVAPDVPPGTPGRPVQGHPTRYVDDKGYRTLRVLDAVEGTAVAVSGLVPQADLYDIANRLILPS
jgi:hypothetical protein